MPATSAAQQRLMEAAAHTKGGYGGVPQKVGKEFTADKLNEEERSEADRNHESREEMPPDAFLDSTSRKYPVKAKKVGQWKYDKDLLEAAASEARMHHHDDMAAKADTIRKREFGGAQDELTLAVLAFDRATVRTIDADGRLHVEVSNISKATVNPYLGAEIPDHETLGLDPTRVYQLLRSPEELEKGAPTFNNIPLLNQHIPVSVDDHQPDAVIGATGSNAEFIAPYLRNSLVVWEAVAIAGINSRQQCELSCAYRYKAVMTPGEYQGMSYDGIMTDIVGNHVALVEVGRAGSDVVVGDSNPFKEKFDMKKASRKAIAVRAALGAYLRPLLAQDAAIGDLGALVRDVRGATQEKDLDRISKSVLKATKGKLAADAELEPKEVDKVIKSAAEEAPDDDLSEDDDAQREDETDEEYAERMKKKEAEDDEPDKDKSDTKAMDAAIKAAVTAAERSTIARMNAIRLAEKEVGSVIGEIAAMDSASDYYKMALDHLGVKLDGVPASAYRAIFNTLQAKAEKPKVAQDSANVMADFKAMFPSAVIPARS